MVVRRKAFSFISRRDFYQRFSPSQISDTPQAGFEPALNQSSGFPEKSCVVVIPTTSQYNITCRIFKSRIMKEICNSESLIKPQQNIIFSFFKYFYSGYQVFKKQIFLKQIFLHFSRFLQKNLI